MVSRFYPTAKELIEMRAQRVANPLLTVRRSIRSILGYVISATFAFVIVTILVYFFGHLRIEANIPVVSSLSFHLLYIVPVLIALEAWRQYLDDLYLFEAERIVHKGGRLSLQYSVPSVRYIDVRALGIRESIIGRIFDYGTLRVETAALDACEMVIDGVRSPHELRRLIDQLRAEVQAIEEKKASSSSSYREKLED